MVEVFALRSFFASITEDDFRVRNEILEKLRLACVAGDYATIAEQDVAFHRSIGSRARQQEETIWGSLIAHIRFHFSATQARDYNSPLEIYDEHMYIVKAIQTGDVEAAVRVLERNIG